MLFLAKIRWLNYLLLPLSLIYYLLFILHKFLYKTGILRVYFFNKPIIVVGNIVVGGTGKTPVVIALVNFFTQEGKKVGVVSRGYGRIYKNLVVVNDNLDAYMCGDEPLLIKKTTQAIVVVANKRYQAVAKIISDYDVDIIISDDGLQHYALGRDIEIALNITTKNNFLLPAGPYRESKKRLDSVDFVLNKNNKKLLNDCFINLLTKEQKPLNYFKDKEALAICAIANPELFFKTLIALNINITKKIFTDHHNFTQDDLDTNKVIIMTTKDWVKCEKFATDNMWYLQTNIKIADDFYKKLKEKLCLIKKS